MNIHVKLWLTWIQPPPIQSTIERKSLNVNMLDGYCIKKVSRMECDLVKTPKDLLIMRIITLRFWNEMKMLFIQRNKGGEKWDCCGGWSWVMCSDVLCSHWNTRTFWPYWSQTDTLVIGSWKRDGFLCFCLLSPYSPGGQRDVYTV